MAVVIDIDFQMDKMYGLKLASQSKSTVGQVTRDALSVVGREAMRGAASEISKILSPGHKFRVGVTGEASRNFIVRKISESDIVVWGVEEIEGGHNRFIREGRSPGRAPPMSKILKWLILKSSRGDIKPVAGEHAIRFTKRGGARANITGRAGRPFKADRKRVHQGALQYAAWAIAQSMAAGGANISHTRLVPQGQQHFDYVAYVVRHRQDIFRKPLRDTRVINDVQDIVINFLRTGRHVRGQTTTYMYPFGR
jgi:hypothetical protein